MNVMKCNHRWLIVASLATMWMVATTGNAAAAEQPRIDLTADSPFGVVCPCPGVSKAGIKWCRVGAGATPLANWPGIEKERRKFDWTDADAELKNLDARIKSAKQQVTSLVQRKEEVQLADQKLARKEAALDDLKKSIGELESKRRELERDIGRLQGQRDALAARSKSSGEEAGQ